MDGEDERDCTLPNSCQEWWDAGYQTSGIYTICEFTNNVMRCLCQKRQCSNSILFQLLIVGALHHENTPV